ncbi:MAG: GSCFA domain-containing protein [Crocinitomicaceae bacterium]|nr:GSCFA domain-containing protein [Crocinitomicaceae bacterium]
MKKTCVEWPVIKKIELSAPVAFIGSCFAEHVSSLFAQHGLFVNTNPFGVIFNPVSLHNMLHAFNNPMQIEENIFSKEDVYLHWGANSKLHGYSKVELLEKMNHQRLCFISNLKDSKVLFITLGTAIVYERISNGAIVANCHKMPAQDFTKKLLSLEEVIVACKGLVAEIKAIQPEIDIIWTISPVRHSKEGLSENSLSKATLRLALAQVCAEDQNNYYLPVYEYFIDELRDYAWFSADGVHPNSIAIDALWEQLTSLFFTKTDQAILKQFYRFLQAKNHQPIHSASEANIAFQEKLRKDIADFTAKHGHLNTQVLLNTSS